MRLVSENFGSLGRAMLMSLGLHAAVLVAADFARDPKARAKHSAPPAALSAHLQPARPLRPPPVPPQLAQPQLDQPPLELPPSKRAAAVASKPAATKAPLPDTKKPARVPLAPENVRRHALSQLAERLLYPPEAIDQGLEGDVLVMLFLDATGNVIAARVERGSGHAMLDQAAVVAARQLRSLPAAAQREFLLPVRFRLD